MAMGGSGPEGVVGFTGESGGGFTGTTGVAGSGASPGSGGLGAILKILQDPQVIQALGQFGKDMGKTMDSVSKLPPELQSMFQKVVQGQGQGQKLQVPPAAGPYLGDIAAFQNPTFARNALREFGIPVG